MNRQKVYDYFKYNTDWQGYNKEWFTKDRIDKAIKFYNSLEIIDFEDTSKLRDSNGECFLYEDSEIIVSKFTFGEFKEVYDDNGICGSCHFFESCYERTNFDCPCGAKTLGVQDYEIIDLVIAINDCDEYGYQIDVLTNRKNKIK